MSGIPAAALFADSPKFEHVYGFQRDSPSSGYKIAMLNRGESPLKGEEPGLEETPEKSGRGGKIYLYLGFLEDRGDGRRNPLHPDAVQEQGRSHPRFLGPERGYPERQAATLPGMLVVLESTITPGRPPAWPAPCSKRSRALIAGVDFALAHAPERVMVGRLLRNIREHDRIVGGIDPVSTARATELYAPVLTLGRVIPMTATAAEVTKTAENTFRDLQIAAANELRSTARRWVSTSTM